jgi:Ca2+-binding EF-hand superfamily protein
MRSLVLATALVSVLALVGVSTAHAQTLLADANNDGKVTAAEYQNNRRAFLLRADHDKDGKLSQAEWDHGAAMLRQEVRESGTDGWQLIGKAGLFATLDTNRDGFVTPAEIDTATAARFAQLDPDHDGVITRKEAAALDRKAPKP